MMVAILGTIIFMPSHALAMGSNPKEGKAITVVQENGVWWFKDTEGKKFFSLGVCCIGGCFGHAEEKPMTPAMEEETALRLKAWGFNTAGAWSSPSIWKHVYIVDQIYPAYKHEVSDIFAPGFGSTVFESHLANEIASFKDKKRLIGYCIDNEVDWGSQKIFGIYLERSATTTGSMELVSFTRNYCGDKIETLNRLMGTSFKEFSEMAGTKMPKEIPDGMWDLMTKWRNHCLETYYRGYTAIIRRLDPDRLILGTRYKGWEEPDICRIVGKYIDVNSMNTYNRYGDMFDFMEDLYKITGKPVMITEYSFSGFPEPGKATGLFSEVYTQQNRARGYNKFVSEAASAPFMVGMHWFMWNDYETKEGQVPWAGPDQNVGLVTKDFKKPYQTLVDECAKTNNAVPGIHEKSKGWKLKPDQAFVSRDIPFFKATVDGELGEWPENTAIKPELIRSLAEKVDFDHTFYLAQDGEYFYLGAKVADNSLVNPGDGDTWHADYLLLYVFNEDSSDDWNGKYYFLFPTGNGKKKDEPFAGAWTNWAPDKDWTSARKGGNGVYTMEARMRISYLGDNSRNLKRKYKLIYHDVSGIYDTGFSGEGKRVIPVTNNGK